MQIGIDALIGFDAIATVGGGPDVCLHAVGIDRFAGFRSSSPGADAGPAATRGRWMVTYADGTSVRCRRLSDARGRVRAGRALGARLRRHGQDAPMPMRSWRVVGGYDEVEVVEVERRPNPRPSRVAHVARLVLAVALVAVTARVPGLALVAACSAAALVLGARLGRWVVEYAQREFVAQWRVLACTLGPAAAFLTWVALRIHSHS